MSPDRLQVFDDVLPDPEAYRAQALAASFGSVTIGAATFHGIAPCPTTTLRDRVEALCGDLGPITTFFRQSPAGQVEPNYIHTDRDMGGWTGILYLTEVPRDGDGTTFWRWRATGATSSQALTMDDLVPEWLAWRDLAQWEPWQTVEARFNRLVLFPSGFFHSRALPENYGTDAVSARLIQVMFGGTDVCRH